MVLEYVRVLLVYVPWYTGTYPPKTHVVLSAHVCVPFSNQKVVT
jgi:hypothetical protein